MFVILLVTNRADGGVRRKRPAKVISDVRADLADAAALAVTDANLAVAEMPVSFRADREVGWNRAVRPARSVRRKVIVRTKSAIAIVRARPSGTAQRKTGCKERWRVPCHASPTSVAVAEWSYGPDYSCATGLRRR